MGFRKDENGYSLTEVIVVLVIMGVVTTIPVLMIGSAKVQFTRQTFVRELKSSLERARFDSIKRKPESKDRMSRVVINTGSFQLVTYKNTTGSVDATGVAQVQKSETKTLDVKNGVLMAHSASGIGNNFPVTVAFDARGEIVASDSGNNVIVNPAFVVCDANCGTPTPQNSSMLLISPAGTVALLPGGSAITTFSAPSGSTGVSQTSGINKLVTITGN